MPTRAMKETPDAAWKVVEQLLEQAPSRRVLDLGCGEGRHARLLAEQGCQVVGIDASEAAIERAKAHGAPEGVEFLVGEMGAVEGFVRGQFGLALCLGNALPHLLTAESLSRMLVGLRRRILPGGSIVFQLLNYERILADSVRALPVEFFPSPPSPPSPDGELIVLRHLGLPDEHQEGILLHTTTTLRHRPKASPAMEVVGSSQAQLRAWRHEELEILLDTARWADQRIFADLDGSAFDRRESAELVVVAS